MGVAMAMLAAAAIGPYSGASVDNLLDTPNLELQSLWTARAEGLARLSTGAQVVEIDGQTALQTGDGFRLVVSIAAASGHCRLDVVCTAPNRGTDSFFVDLNGERLPQLLVPPVGRIGMTSITVPMPAEGKADIVLSLREGPGSRILSASLSRIAPSTVLPPMLASLRSQRPRLLLNRACLEQLRSTASTPKIQAIYTPPKSLRKPPKYRPGKRNGSAFRRLGDHVLAYMITPVPRDLDAIMEWLEMATTYGDVGVDLDAEYFMEGIALAYDWLHGELPADLRQRLGVRIAELCGELYTASLAGKTGGGHSFQQNHYWFAHLALTLGAAALVGDNPVADQWLAWSWDRFERIALSFSTDGGFHEGPAYWDFSMPTLYMYVDLYESLTGRGVPGMDAGLAGQGTFRIHHVLPGLHESAPLEDTKVHIKTSSPALYRWEAQRFSNPVLQGAAACLSRGPSSSKLALLWYDEELNPAANPLARIPLAQHYPDIDTAFARTSWDADATYAAFVCRPLGGHRYAELCDRFGIGGTGHNHPAQGHFLLFGRGEVLAADPGYTYKKETRNHNTILVDGKGQYGDGEMWPRPQPGRAHITAFAHKNDMVVVTGDATSAYPAELGLRRFERTLVVAGPDLALVYDRLGADAPRTFSWLLHHWGESTPEGNDRVLAVGDARCRLHPLGTGELSVSEQTYRPQFIHPTRDLTPENADIALVQYDTAPLEQATIAMAISIGDATAPPEPPVSIPCTNGVAIVLDDALIAIRTGPGPMQIAPTSGPALTSSARVVVATRRSGPAPAVLEVE
ncbi:MAG: DUF4962 domain-containing protein [Lentisphaerae bacterium]|jgi:hypothetical protein|nr:DUF4962 domain-containing protein [Lentisphaerota bacterium]MBT5605760.1 DUF4962 domain-containing protein [Lentisphaerota bacterium]MBT7053917.1 DUF4962 domain-containing protein [Lentisphaerota bacterium]MBT7843941.1 DUF4962 domain-containing protein [Lentisphaerota bacterium]